jgi:glycosyltransferase involved in cell wall biosynthesis
VKLSDSLSGLASIIIPSCNPLGSTRQCIAELTRFTRRPWELIVVDNGSSDETSAYLASVRDAVPVPVTVIAGAQAEESRPRLTRDWRLRAASTWYCSITTSW